MSLNMHFLVVAIICVFSTFAEAQPRKLSLDAAIAAALENNAEVQLSEEREIQAKARADEMRAQLLPDTSASFGHSNQSINLAARGIQIPNAPARVGPFGTTDLRVQFSEPVFDLSLIRRYRATRKTQDASSQESESIKDAVSALVGQIYFDVQRADALVEATRSQITLDENLLQLAQQKRDAGVGTGLDVTRAESRLAADKYRLLEAQNTRRTAELRLLHAMGERLDLKLELTDALDVPHTQATSFEKSLERALQQRADWIAQDRKLASARLSSQASSAERLPSIHAFADYGSIGNAGTFLPSHTAGVQLVIPLFDGGRRRAHRDNAASLLRQEEIRANDLRNQIELEVRTALDRLSSAQEQVRAAEQRLALAHEEFELARLRFEAQVAPQIDVVQAQAELEDARSQRVTALFSMRIGEIDYLRAIGGIRK